MAVVLLLRKFGSRVYGPQVVGRGLRRVRRSASGDAIDPDEPQICAIVDHPKLEHGWLWEQLNAVVRSGVGLDETHDEQDDLPPPPPRQELVRPDLVIEVPEPEDDGAPGLDPVTAADSPAPARDWRERLDALDYEAETVEITDVTLSGVTGRELGRGGWTRHGGAPDGTALPPPPPGEQGEDALRDHLRESLYAIAELAAVEAGYPALMRRHVYSPLLAHVSARWLGGEAIPFADEDALRRAAARLPQLERHMTTRTDIVGGMIEHGADGGEA